MYACVPCQMLSKRFERLHVMHDGFMCSEIAAVKEEHAAELESICAGACSRSAWRSGESDPQVNALQSRNRTLQDKIQQQSSVIVELMEEVERLAEVENAMGVCCNRRSSSSSPSVVALQKFCSMFSSKHTLAQLPAPSVRDKFARRGVMGECCACSWLFCHCFMGILLCILK
jgi:hypothetical protein